MPTGADIQNIQSWTKYAAQLEAQAQRCKGSDQERYDRLMDEASRARRYAREILAELPAQGPMQ